MVNTEVIFKMQFYRWISSTSAGKGSYMLSSQITFRSSGFTFQMPLLLLQRFDKMLACDNMIFLALINYFWIHPIFCPLTHRVIDLMCIHYARTWLHG